VSCTWSAIGRYVGVKESVCYVDRKGRCVYVSCIKCITELYRKMLVTTNHLNTKFSYSGTSVPQTSAFKMFIYTLRYVSDEFFDIQAQQESYHTHSRYVMPACWSIKSLVNEDIPVLLLVQFVLETLFVSY
jgi:hypothetical protein